MAHISPDVREFLRNSVRKNNLSVEALEERLWLTIFSSNADENIYGWKRIRAILFNIAMLKYSFLKQEMRSFTMEYYDIGPSYF